MPKRIFLGWNRPFSESVVDWLANQVASDHSVSDYSHLLVLAPIRQAIPAVLEVLAARHQAFLPPRILTPQLLPGLDASAPNRVPDRRTMKLMWMEIMRADGVNFLSQLRPGTNTPPTTTWISSMAEEIMTLHEELTRQGWTIGEAAKQLSADGQRWAALAGLENKWEKRLASEGWTSPHHAWAALNPDSFSALGIDHVVIAGIPDLIPAARRVLETLAPSPVTILIHAPEDEADHFDSWGSPAPEHWTGPLSFPQLDEQLHLLRRDEDVIEQTEKLLRAHELPAACSIATPRDDLRTAISARLEEEEISHINRAGDSALKLPLTGFLFHLASVLQSPSRTSLMALLSHPWMAAPILKATGEDQLDPLLDKIDALLLNHPWQNVDDLEHISPTWKENREFAQLFYGALKEWLTPFHSVNGLSSLREFLADQPWREEIPEEDIPQVADVLEFWIDPRHGNTYSLLECLELCLSDLRHLRIFESSNDLAPHLHGWVDSSWSSSPHLIIAGLQEGSIPRPAFRHLFLTRSSAKELGFPSEASLHACDAFLLQSLIESRAGNGRIDLLVSRSDLKQNPLLPSRLLAIADSEVLSERITQLFTLPTPKESSEGGAPVRFQIPSPPASRDKGISVTAFKRYLESPFYYYLTDVLGWQTLDVRRYSMDPRDYGTLTHRAIELFLNETDGKPGTDVNVIEAGLLRHLDRVFHNLVGKSPHLGLEIQVDSIRSRLRAYAHTEADLRSEGWETIAVERKFHLALNDWTITGKIDRIDRHPDGRIRILDYKTSDQPDPPVKAHLKSLKSNTTCLDEAIFSWKGKDHCWINLQLPLYAASQMEEFSGAKAIETGYIQLAKAVEDTGLALWNDFDSELIDASLACAKSILNSIDAGKFESPAIFNAHQWDFWHRFMGPEAFESFDFQWSSPEPGGASG
jgi:ATP-dependent helicase/nuclease subunit B